MGPPCVGKTSFKSLLFNWPAPKLHHSTAIATRPIRAIERVAERNEGNIWEKVTGLDLLKMLSDAIRALDQEPDIKLSEPPIPESASNSVPPIDQFLQPTSNDHIKSKEQDAAVEQIDHSMDNLAIPSNNIPSFSESAGSPNVADSTKDLLPSKPKARDDRHITEMMKVYEERNISEDLHKATWINILDSGGQPQFADVSRAFIRGNTMNIICTKLTESLSDKPQFCYSLNGKLLNLPNELQMTNLQLIEHFVRSIVASKNAVVVKGKKRLPLFMIIGTYHDKTGGLKKMFFESLRLKNEQLLSILHEFRDHFIFYNDDPQELIFPVDNLCRWNRKKISSFLRKCIMSHQKDIGITVPIPVRWYMFEMSLKEEASQHEHGMILLDTCCSIGRNYSMNQDDVLESITYLHSMALFLYFPVLPHVIFTNPQYLLDILSDLIRVSFVHSLEDILLEGQSLPPDTQEIFCTKGVFDDSLLDKLSLPFVSKLFTKIELLKLLQYLCIIAPLFTSDSLNRYFMPVVLPPNQVEDNLVAMFTTECDPMIIAFESKVVPQVRNSIFYS